MVVGLARRVSSGLVSFELRDQKAKDDEEREEREDWEEAGVEEEEGKSTWEGV